MLTRVKMLHIRDAHRLALRGGFVEEDLRAGRRGGIVEEAGAEENLGAGRQGG